MMQQCLTSKGIGREGKRQDACGRKGLCCAGWRCDEFPVQCLIEIGRGIKRR